MCPTPASRVVLLWRAVALSTLALVGAGRAPAQTVPADSVRADSARVDTLRADAALPPDTTAAAARPVGSSAPATSPALPRVELVSTARPVVLVRGAGAARPAAPPIESARVQIDAEGQRTLVYSERAAPPPDLGAELGCGPGAGRAIIRLGNLSTETLLPGDEGPLVGAAQQLLCVAGYAVPPDGRFELEMEAAVLAFQSDYNATASPEEQVVVSGTLDEQTRRALEDRARARLAP